MPGQRYGVEIRSAASQDAAELARLLALAGLKLDPAEAAPRLEAVRAAGGAVLVATGWPGLAGLAEAHWCPALHAARPVAWLSLLLVDPEERRRGIGRLLLKAASQAARAAACDTLAADPAGAEAEAFCLATGFVRGGAHMVRGLRRRGP